jgi:predicted branched-subunit amino acid permease
MAGSAMGQDGMSSPAPQPITTLSAYRDGLAATGKSVFSYVLFGTYIGIGALSHDFGFSIVWALACTILVWAGPAQVILISALGAGSGLAEAALAVGISSARLLPMVVALLPMLKKGNTPSWKLLLPAHFTAVSMWVEAMRLLPARGEGRIAFCNGLGTGYMITATAATLTGFYLAARLPPLASGALLFLTPLAFFMSTLRNARELVDRLAFALGIVIGPLLAYWQLGLDLLWSGIAGGTLAYALHRLREATR